LSSTPKLTPFERTLTLITKVRPGEGRVVALFGAHIFLVLFSYYLFRAARSGFLLDKGSAVKGAYATAVIAALLILVVPLYSALRRLFDGPKLVSTIIAFFVGSLVTFWLVDRSGADIGFAFYVFVGIFNVMMIAQFWALAADSFNVKTGQRLFPAIMLAAQLGAIAGTQFTAVLSQPLGANNLLLVGAVALVLTALITGPMHGGVPDESRHLQHDAPHQERKLLGGFGVVAASRYLTLIAIMVVLINWISSTGDFVFNSFVKQHFEAVVAASSETLNKRDLITAYVGNFFFWIIVIQLFVQAFLVGRLFRWFGVASTLLIAPLISLIGYAMLGFAPVLSMIRLVRTMEQSAEYSITNTCRQALFLPVDRTECYEGKTTIETFFWRFGDLLQAGMVWIGTNQLGWGITGFAFLNVALAAFWFAVALLVGQEYRRLATENLTNEAPTLNRPIPDAHWHAGGELEHQVPADCFVDSDPGDVMTLSARLADGSPLPDWLRFDHHHGRFHAAGVDVAFDQLVIEVVATDHDGMSASGTFVLRRTVVSAG
jgi:AAA family ATP:ADP antiporter